MDGQFLNETATPFQVRSQYQNFIGGEWIAPRGSLYLPHIEPFNATKLCDFARSRAEDMTFALGAAHAARNTWGATAPSKRRTLLCQMTAQLETHADALAGVLYKSSGGRSLEACEVEITHAIGHFREASVAFSSQDEIFYRTLQNVCVQFLPETYAVLTAAWAISQAVQRGETIVLKPAVATSIPVLALVDLLSHLSPDGVVNLVTGYDHELECAVSTGNTPMQVAPLNLLSSHPNAKPAQVFFADVCDEMDGFQMRAIESFCAFVQCQSLDSNAPTRAFIHQDIYDSFLPRALAHLKYASPQVPLPNWEQYERSLAYIQIGRNEGAKLLCGGRPDYEAGAGYFLTPTVLAGENAMRVFQDSIGGPILSVSPFASVEEAVGLVDDTPDPTSVGIWRRNTSTAFETATATPNIQVNAFQTNPDHPAFSTYEQQLRNGYQPRETRHLTKCLALAG